MNIGDIIERNGKKYEVLALLGSGNFSMKELKNEPVLEAVPVLEAEVEEEIPVVAEKKTRRRKKA